MYDRADVSTGADGDNDDSNESESDVIRWAPTCCRAPLIEKQIFNREVDLQQIKV